MLLLFLTLSLVMSCVSAETVEQPCNGTTQTADCMLRCVGKCTPKCDIKCENGTKYDCFPPLTPTYDCRIMPNASVEDVCPVCHGQAPKPFCNRDAGRCVTHCSLIPCYWSCEEQGCKGPKDTWGCPVPSSCGEDSSTPASGGEVDMLLIMLFVYLTSDI